MEVENSKVSVKVTPIKKKASKPNYLNKRDMLRELENSKSQNKMTNELAKMLMLLCDRYAKKPSFANYTYVDDMKGYAIMMLVRTWTSFNAEKSDNPFAFFTQCIHHSFVQFLNQEKKQRNIRDLLLIDGGMAPSNTFISEHEKETLSFDEIEVTPPVV